ncbi:hypothetical protein LF599_07365 [Pseudodesulfovibrio thermohalotolerans]|uniref:hypothetical protein n=1 Tax=Pseudodesulfovibrio thermohalotolerans TaxID=2880651 RepID=UPI0024416DAB|nr:hypothetical protein [Pseudodesulfovibrio thermohalotolerans]WFS63973.1 hypothetical protein LF599_07365 [Pseudodesulfovibrio thermohalotolerans]
MIKLYSSRSKESKFSRRIAANVRRRKQLALTGFYGRPKKDGKVGKRWALKVGEMWRWSDWQSEEQSPWKGPWGLMVWWLKKVVLNGLLEA